MFGRSKFSKLPANKLVKGVPYKPGDLVFALNNKAKIYWPARVKEVQKKKCRIEFFATKEQVWRKTKKIFPYEENKEGVREHETEALFYKAWQDVECDHSRGCDTGCETREYPARGRKFDLPKPDKRFKRCVEKVGRIFAIVLIDSFLFVSDK